MVAERLVTRRWERIKVWNTRIDAAIDWGGEVTKRAIGYGLLWVASVNTGVLPLWLSGVVMPPLLLALVWFGGHRAAHILRYTYILDKHAHAFVRVATSFGIGSLVGIAIIFDKEVIRSLVNASTLDRFYSLAAVIAMLWVIASAACAVSSGLFWMVMPPHWKWARELAARVSTGTTLLTPILFLPYFLLLVLVQVTATGNSSG